MARISARQGEAISDRGRLRVLVVPVISRQPLEPRRSGIRRRDVCTGKPDLFPPVDHHALTATSNRGGPVHDQKIHSDDAVRAHRVGTGGGGVAEHTVQTLHDRWKGNISLAVNARHFKSDVDSAEKPYRTVIESRVHIRPLEAG